jgi:hypothetical protein
MPAAQTTLRLTRFLLGQWYICLLLAAIVIGETWRIGKPEYTGNRGWLTRQVQQFVNQRWPPPQFAGNICYFGPLPYAQAWRASESDPWLVVLRDYSDRDIRFGDTELIGDDATSQSILNPNPVTLLQLFIFTSTTTARYGIWRSLVSREAPQLQVASIDATGVIEADQGLHRAVAERLAEQQIVGWDEYRRVAQSVLNGPEPLVPAWPAIAHDAALLLATAGFLSGFWFVPRRKRYTRRNARLRRGLCPICAYDTTGLTTCPECGHGPAPIPQTP